MACIIDTTGRMLPEEFFVDPESFELGPDQCLMPPRIPNLLPSRQVS